MRKLFLFIAFTTLVINVVCECNSDNDCGGHGKCIQKICNCDYGYISYNTTNITNITYCNYVQKFQLKAFLLELIVGFGAGNFYIGNTNYAILKLISFILCLFLICLFPLTAKCINDRYDSNFWVLIVSCFYYYCSLALAFWYIFDLVRFGMNLNKDSQSQDLAKW